MQEPVVMPIIIALLLIFVGGGGQSFCLGAARALASQSTLV
jgi:hypothetical protein